MTMKECCSYQGCIWKRENHPVLGHYLWTIDFAIMKLKKRFKAFIKSFSDLDYSQIDDVEMDGIDTRDYPDFCDAYVASATYKGRDMTQAELDRLNEDGDFVHEHASEWVC